MHEQKIGYETQIEGTESWENIRKYLLPYKILCAHRVRSSQGQGLTECDKNLMGNYPAFIRLAHSLKESK